MEWKSKGREMNGKEYPTIFKWEWRSSPWSGALAAQPWRPDFTPLTPMKQAVQGWIKPQHCGAHDRARSPKVANHQPSQKKCKLLIQREILPQWQNEAESDGENSVPSSGRHILLSLHTLWTHHIHTQGEFGLPGRRVGKWKCLFQDWGTESNPR